MPPPELRRGQGRTGAWPRRAHRAIDPLLQPLARLERQHLARGDLDAVPGLRIAPAPGGLLADAEVAEAHDLHILALLEAVEDDVEDGLHDRRRLPLGKTVRGDGIHQVVLGHGGPSPCHGLASFTAAP
jgi:hypothetical protein